MGAAVALLASLALLGAPAAADAAPDARPAATCDDYQTQADAQRAADTRDSDGDGIYCEALPYPCLRPGSGGDDDADRRRESRERRRAQFEREPSHSS